MRLMEKSVAFISCLSSTANRSVQTLIDGVNRHLVSDRQFPIRTPFRYRNDKAPGLEVCCKEHSTKDIDSKMEDSAFIVQRAIRSVLLPAMLALRVIFSVPSQSHLALSSSGPMLALAQEPFVYKNVAWESGKCRMSPSLCVANMLDSKSNTNEKAVGGMGCIVANCPIEFSSCLANPKCASGLRCFIQCAISDATSTRSDNALEQQTRTEGSCQTRCMDLYQNTLLDEFTECSLTNNRCYPPLRSDHRYPPIRFNDRMKLWQEDLLVPKDTAVGTNDDAATASNTREEKYLKNLFRGRWLIAAGLNPAFDTFDCQVHEFYDPITAEVKNHKSEAYDLRNNKNAKTTNGVAVADASFFYRVPLDADSNRKGSTKWFTKQGDKRITLDFPSKESAKEDEIGREYDDLRFDPNKKWGIDNFRGSIEYGKERGNSGEFSNNASRKHRLAPRLILSLRPDLMHYKDELVVLSSSPDEYIVLLYRGSNSAWDGYGGLNIYTRSGKLSMEKEQLHGISEGLRKVGLELSDLILVDNTCSKN